MSNVTDEIKSKLDIIDVVSEYVQLKPAGTSFKAICPFHREKAPSFFVSPEKQIWHCFGCQKGSDLFGFLQEIEGIEFPEALRILANKAGVKIEKQDRRLISQKTKLLDICRLSAKFYHKILLQSPLAEQARKYLKQRALNKKIITEFELGFAPEKWDSLLKFLTKRGYKEKDIETAGLIIASKTGQSRYHDRFRSRIMFPIYDLYSQVVGFTSRVLPGTKGEDKTAKYINTPETPIYNKSRVLYGLDKAKLEIKLEDRVILVEGNTDVLAVRQMGNKNVVCTSGTALTNEQIKILNRYTENIILAFDVDLAGQTATQRSIDLLLGQGLNVKVLDLAKGKDPDECIRKTPGVWKKALKSPLQIMEYYFSSAFKGRNLTNLDDKKEVTKLLLPIIAKLGDPVDQGLWLRKLSDELDVSEIFLREALRRVRLPKIYSKESESISKQRPSQEQQVSDRFLGLILKYPELGQEFLNKLVLDMFVDNRAQSIIREIRECYSKKQKISFKKVKSEIKSEQIVNYLNGLVFLVEREFKDYSESDIAKELKHFFAILKKQYLNKKMQKLVDDLKLVEQKGNKKEIEKISQKIVRLSREIAK